MSELTEEDVIEILHQVVADVDGEPRAGQDTMAREVWRALNDEGHLLVEAGTGTGKSFGYLVPLILWATETGQRATISTATLALQRQIMTKDAPRVSRIIAQARGTHPRVALLKGWNNYACMRKVTGGYPEDDALISRAEGEFGATATGEQVVRARDWAMSTDTGDRDDLIPGVSERAWAQVSIPKRECIGDSCVVRESCFPMLARADAEDADVVVTNHAMLGIQAAGTPVLPETHAYVVDEGHELADRVTNQLTRALTKYELTSVARLLRREGIASELDESAEELEEVLETLDEGRLVTIPEALGDVVARTLGRCQKVAEEVAGLSAADEAKAISKQVLRSRLGELVNVCQDVLSEAIEKEQLVAWVSPLNDDATGLYLAPLDVSAPIADRLFENTPVVLASATLQVGGKFDTMAAQVGFTFPSQGPWEGIDVGSPFSPEKQGVLYVAKHLPPPGRDGYGEENLTELAELVEASGGGALCLFTSRAAAERAADFVRERTNLPVLCQGEDQLATLVDEFALDDDSSLFGTLSLWQGVDIPGRACRLVVIDRIPFPRPNDPLIQARSEAVRKAGGNDFMQVSVAHAALLLAQGAGRLLRRMTDRGVVAVLDSRLRTRRYGNVLLASMPRMWPTTDPAVVRGVLERLRDATD